MKRALLFSTVCLLTACNALGSGDETQNTASPAEDVWIMDHRDPGTLPPMTVEDAPAASVSSTQTLPPVAMPDPQKTTLVPASEETKQNLAQLPVRDTLLKGDAARLALLENEVKRLHEELTNMRNSMQKIVTAEGFLKELSLDLERINQQYDLTTPSNRKSAPVSQPARQASASKSAPASAVQKSSPATSGKREVHGVRYGKNGAATRIVLDLGASVQYTTDLDNTEKVLIVEMPDTFWAAQSNGNGSGVIQEYAASTTADGTSRMILQLKQPVKIQTAKVLPPSGSYGNRLYIDLLPQ